MISFIFECVVVLLSLVLCVWSVENKKLPKGVIEWAIIFAGVIFVAEWAVGMVNFIGW